MLKSEIPHLKNIENKLIYMYKSKLLGRFKTYLQFLKTVKFVTALLEKYEATEYLKASKFTWPISYW